MIKFFSEARLWCVVGAGICAESLTLAAVFLCAGVLSAIILKRLCAKYA